MQNESQVTLPVSWIMPLKCHWIMSLKSCKKTTSMQIVLGDRNVFQYNLLHKWGFNFLRNALRLNHTLIKHDKKGVVVYFDTPTVKIYLCLSNQNHFKESCEMFSVGVNI